MKPRRLVRYGVRQKPSVDVVRVDAKVHASGRVMARYVGGGWSYIGFARDETMLRDVLRNYRPTREAMLKEALRLARLDVKVARKALDAAEAELAALAALRENKPPTKKVTPRGKKSAPPA